MTERVPKTITGCVDSLSIAGLLDASLRPGGAISLMFSDGIVNVILDQAGDWTITAGLSVSSERFLQLTRSLEDLGFFQATEQGGIVYHLWTSVLCDASENRNIAEQILLKVLRSFQVDLARNYIS